jgi:enoyl-CoA hydratase
MTYNTVLYGKEEGTTPGFAIETGKAILDTGINIGLKEGLEMGRLSFFLPYSTEDQREGLRAFLEKRPSRFKGK